MQDHLREKFIDDVLGLLTDSVSTDGGETFFEGCSLSFLTQSLRYRGWKNLSRLDSELSEAGFRIIRARPKKAWAKNPKACQAECNVVTL